MACLALGCSNDDDHADKTSELEKSYLTIENAVYVNDEFPSSTTDEPLEGIDMSSQVMNGAMNYITVVTEKKIQKFYIGVKGVKGYWEYVPTENEASSDSEYYTYVIPVMMSQTYNGNSVIMISGVLDNGEVSLPVENEIFYIETMPGAIEVKLAFSNSKDVDLHVFTPSGEHIFYGARGGTVEDEDGNEISYGLDVDSNAGCDIDNINKENIYIPAELVENGTYTVVVDMYDNCDTSIPTSWSIVARYQEEVITPMTGKNPASGVYPVGAGNGDMTQVMTFTIDDGNRTKARKIKRNTFKPAPLSIKDEMKLEEAEFMKSIK